MSEEILIKYEGGDADNHAVDMRLLGESFQGVDRIVSDLIIVVSAQRVPKRGERAPLVVKAYEPRAGTVSIPAVIQESAGLLQLGCKFGSSASELISSWVRATFLHFGGKHVEAQTAIEKIAEIALAHNATLDRVDSRRHDEIMKMQGIIQATIERQGPAAAQAVAPVGPSVRKLQFFSGGQERISVDDEMADEIRDQGRIEFGPLQTFVLRTDGFTFHTRKLSVEHPERSGFLLAEVEDPIAEEENNPYARAVQRKALIRVKAKAGYRRDQIERLVILDFESELSDAA